MPHDRARPSMWREQFDYYWDGRRRLAIGWFEGAERAAVRPELTVVSARDERFTSAPTLIDVIGAARWRARIIVVDVPSEHRFVRLTAADGAELILALSAERELPQGGDWRLLLTLLPDAGGADPVAFRLAAFPARGDVERLSREQTAAAGARLVWAIGQRRVVERADNAVVIRLAPARRIFPAYQSRLVLEAAPFESSAAADAREAPFAIMEHWLRESGAPRIILRLRIPDSIEESATLLGRCSVALAMNQRRRLKGWTLEQRSAGEPAVDPLTFDDLRQATGDPHEHPDAAETAEPVVVGNLLALLVDPDEAEVDGIALRRSREKAAPGMGETAEIEFYGAALGDDVGLVCPAAAPGDLGVAPVDPGGPAFARLFRVEGDALAPRRATDDEGLLDDLMRRAADAARAATGAAARAVAERAAGLKGRRDKFVASLNGALARAEVAARFEPPGLWDALEPLAQASFAALVIGETGPARARLQQLGGYGAFCADPALAAVIAEGGEFAQFTRPSAEAAPARSAPSLLARYLDACGAQGMAPAGVDATQEARLMRALLKEPDVAALREARVALAIDDGVRREAAKAARLIIDPAAVERARAHFAEAGATDAADMLEAYLDLRRAGGWAPPHEAPTLAALVARAGVERDVARLEAESLAQAPPAQERSKGLFAAMRGLFGR
ncbi:hypothetical protein IYX23_15385 [Methylocystis sp. L43]|uniref:hypothetical protein n=1 Tax=unclassified Methylocystis TaxID=2625913 RepID=UPI0018C3042C|nr:MULTISPECIES: hypothetical protein [unclassified Methylocystis]MBG0799052.1 hypothetical protein [Methylocystis sp. L43]MBG0806573.1 hypothetical protein [Methylocystis sp. H15]